MNKYANGKIYKVCLVQEEMCYIGATCDTLIKRMSRHRNSAKYENQRKTACCALFEMGIPYIELIENFPCSSKAELEARERYWVEQTTGALNKNIPTRTWQERVAGRREEIALKNKEWQIANRESVARKQKERRDRMTAEERKAKDKAEYAKRREVMLEKKKERTTCECGKEMNRNSLWTHKKVCPALRSAN